MKDAIQEEQQLLSKNLKVIDSIIEDLREIKTSSYGTESDRLEKIQRYNKAKESPYFGRIDIIDNGISETLYIGKTGIAKDNTEIVVIDWRADIAQVFYSFNGGNNVVSYRSGNNDFQLKVTKKRQIEISKFNVSQVIEVLANVNNEKKTNKSDTSLKQSVREPQGEFIKKVLSKRNDTHRLKDIIASIQIEQDEIIRLGINKPIIVQGAAGSGKSSIAIHRISYLLYKYRDQLKPNEILIMAPNRMFISFMQSILPELDISGIGQSTFYSWALEQLKSLRLRFKEPYELLAAIVNENIDYKSIETFAKYKGSIRFKTVIDNYLSYLEENFLPRGMLYVNNNNFLDKSAITTYLRGKARLPLNERIEALVEYIKSWAIDNQKKEVNQLISEFNLINNRWIAVLPENDNDRNNLNKTVDKIYDLKLKAVNSEYDNAVSQYITLLKRFDPVEIYKNLLTPEMLRIFEPEFSDDTINEICKNALDASQKKFEYEDLAPILYIFHRINGLKVKVGYLVVDEAQDLSPLELQILINASDSMTILGDVTQSIYSFRSLENWSDVIPDIFDTEAVKLLNLEVSYRSTYDIMSLANGIIKNSGLPLSLVTPVERYGEKPRVQKILHGKDLFDNILNSINLFIEKGYKIIAVIGKDNQQTKSLYEHLKEYKGSSVQLVLDGTQPLEGQIIVIPSYLVKGLEFDAVIIPNANSERFTKNPIDTKLLYVCVTRAHHELHIYYHGELTPLLDGVEIVAPDGPDSTLDTIL